MLSRSSQAHGGWSSMSTSQAAPTWATICMQHVKGALNSMQHGLIDPLAAKGIRINRCPG